MKGTRSIVSIALYVVAVRRVLKGLMHHVSVLLPDLKILEGCSIAQEDNESLSKLDRMEDPFV